MPTTQQIFEKAIYILGAEDEAFIADSSKNRDYKARALSIVNTLLAQVFPRLENLSARKKGVRPAALTLSSFAEELPLEEGACNAILPLGLAGHLVLEENPALSEHLLARYEAAISLFSRLNPALFEQIEDVYGGIGHGA